MTGSDRFEAARDVADAVLYEGYLLYPYRASAAKNQLRWQFGVLVPPALASEDGGEHSRCRTEVLLDASGPVTVHVRLRFLHVHRRQVEAVDGDGRHAAVESITVDGRTVRSWDEALEAEHDLHFSLADLLEAGADRTGTDVEVVDEAGVDTEVLRDASGSTPGRLRRIRRALRARVRASAVAVPGPYGGYRVRVDVSNTTDPLDGDGSRDEALRHSLVAAHLLLGVDSGAFLSLVDPPEWARPAAQACVNERCWPVLLGPGDRSDAMLSAPIILYDDPQVAPESGRQLYDSTEIDEILTLRTMALTDEEKDEARETDPRARELLDGIDDMPPEMLERLHGTLRYLRSVAPGEPEQVVPAQPETPWWDPGADTSVSPETDSVDIGGHAVARGSKVRLVPGHRTTDAQDMFLRGHVATVEAVFLDVDGERYLAVTVDGDPGAEIQGAQGRFRYFFPDEVEPLAADPAPATGEGGGPR